MNINDSFKILTGFMLLFLLYHAAEYMIMFQNNIPGFFGFQFLFLVVAWWLGKWQNGNGLAAWGLSITPNIGKPILLGTLFGALLYGTSWLVNIAAGTEVIHHIPNAKNILVQTLPFAFGVIFSSLSEDILTRGYVYFHFHKKLTRIMLIGLSSVIYLLNHIYKLNKGPESWLYILFLGILFILPLLITKQLWFTAAMHWAGNTIFFITHQVIDTQSSNHGLSANYLFCLVIVVFIPLTYVALNGRVRSPSAPVLNTGSSAPE
jgi:membrane protease YdiL (CAAX protease family)